MNVLSIIETLIIGPIKLIFEIIFETAFRITNHPGIAILFLSLTMNILVLPLYRRADAMQEEARDREAALSAGVAHIKKVFSGDERMMILQTYYRQNSYSPVNSLNGSISLLLEIPFFLAAYQFLSHLELLNGISLGPIKDLGAPDGLLIIGGIAINILPILMTLINVVSGALYSKDFPLKTKVQIYGIAAVFLIFLYTSPAGLVFYWTLNNVFSLIKNIFYKLKNPAKILRIFSAAAGVFLLLFGTVIYHTVHMNRKVFLVAVGLLLLLVSLFPLLKKLVHFPEKKKEFQPDSKLFLTGTIFLTILIGLLIPSVFIAASPQEYVDIYYFHNPLWYIVRCFCMAAGTFLIWLRVFYWLADSKGRIFFERIVWIICGITLVNYMFFGTNLGILSPTLQYENGMWFSSRQKLINLIILLIIAAIMYLCALKLKRVAANTLIIAIIALTAMSLMNLITIKTYVDKINPLNAESESPHFQFSTTGQNVIVIMLDRAIGGYIPYLFQNNPKLAEQFAGFTYFENTLSFGQVTNMGSPALLGGYEYTPVEMNRRSNESLASKHNEALMIMPTIFSENGYEVTVCDPVYANYQYIPDLSLFDDSPNVTAYITKGQFGDVERKQAAIDQNYRNFFCFSIMKTLPLFLQPIIYSDGQYYQVTSDSVISLLSYSNQTRESISVATGMDNDFIESYYVLLNMIEMTDITENNIDTFLLMTNDITHYPVLLQKPDYTPAWHVDNTLYDSEHSDNYIVNGREMIMEEDTQIIHYHVNMSTLMRLGDWFDYLRENNVYDNTRIILVADHGYSLFQFEELIIDTGNGNSLDIEHFYPLLMIKDFNSEEFTISDTFMTNADVPTLAMDGIIHNPVNPFTGNPINSDEKSAHDQYIILSNDFDIRTNNGNTFTPSAWASVHDNIWDRSNWTYYDVNMALSDYAAP